VRGPPPKKVLALSSAGLKGLLERLSAASTFFGGLRAAENFFGHPSGWPRSFNARS
jgi:hypothetical protein